MYLYKKTMSRPAIRNPGGGGGTLFLIQRGMEVSVRMGVDLRRKHRRVLSGPGGGHTRTEQSVRKAPCRESIF